MVNGASGTNVNVPVKVNVSHPSPALLKLKCATPFPVTVNVPDSARQAIGGTDIENAMGPATVKEDDDPARADGAPTTIIAKKTAATATQNAPHERREPIGNGPRTVGWGRSERGGIRPLGVITITADVWEVVE